MRFNQEALKSHVTLPSDKEGKLAHKPPKEGYRDRWIKLNGNLLYYLKLNDFGTAKAFESPVGVLVLEACTVQMEPADKYSFVFSIEFMGELNSRKHFFGCQTLSHCREWVEAIQNASHSFLKTRLESLQSEIERLKRQGNVAGLPLNLNQASQSDNRSFTRTLGSSAANRKTLPPPAARPQVVLPKKSSHFFTDWDTFQ